MSGVPYHAWTHLPKEQGGTDPVPSQGGGTAVVHLFSWAEDTRDTVTTDVWTPVANFAGGGFAGPDGYFQETFYSPATAGGMTWDYQSGVITLTEEAAYVVHAWVQWWDAPIVDNELRMVGITFGGVGLRHVMPFRFDIADENLAQDPLPITTEYLLGNGTNTVLLEVFHTAGTDLQFRDAEIVVRKFEAATEPPGVFEENDPF